MTIDGRMVDGATVENFRVTVRTARTIHRPRPEQTAGLYDGSALARALEHAV